MDIISQKKTDAFVALFYHEKRLSNLSKLDTFTDLLAVSVPIVYGALRITAKGTANGEMVEHIFEFLSALLLAMTVAKFRFGWPDKISKHKQQIAANLNLITQADHLTAMEVKSPETIQTFNLFADEIEKGDREITSKVSDKEQRDAYRNALQRFGPQTLCPVCNASPFILRKGAAQCEKCGNLPEITAS